jgi:hypothetical protein
MGKGMDLSDHVSETAEMMTKLQYMMTDMLMPS